MDRSDVAGLSVRVFPVAMDKDVLKIGFTEQLVRWDQWGNKSEDDPHTCARWQSDLSVLPACYVPI